MRQGSDFKKAVQLGNGSWRFLEAANSALLFLFWCDLEAVNSIVVRGACGRDMLARYISVKETCARDTCLQGSFMRLTCLRGTYLGGGGLMGSRRYCEVYMKT